MIEINYVAPRGWVRSWSTAEHWDAVARDGSPIIRVDGDPWGTT